MFCTPLKNLQRRIQLSRRFEGYRYAYFRTAQELPVEWDDLNSGRNLFIERKYLLAQSEGLNSREYFRYVLMFKKDKPLFLAVFHVIDFVAADFGELLENNLSELQSKRKRIVAHYLDHQCNSIVMRLITCGNNLVSGPHAFLADKVLSKADADFLLEKATQVVAKEEKLRGRISATLIKDFYDHKDLPSLPEDHFLSFRVEPNMILHLPGDLHELSDYIALFSKKYRNRAKGILKAGADLIIRNLSAEEIEREEETIYSLYEQVFEKASFKLVKLPVHYFSTMKKALPNHFHVHAYMLNEKMVAFDSAFITYQQELEAHFIGLDYALNKEKELYQNILYQFIRSAIYFKLKTINYGRTASEIKSTVGAKAADLRCYIKPQNQISRLLLKPITSYLSPSEWIPRNPFKEEEKPESEFSKSSSSTREK